MAVSAALMSKRSLSGIGVSANSALTSSTVSLNIDTLFPLSLTTEIVGSFDAGDSRRYWSLVADAIIDGEMIDSVVDEEISILPEALLLL
jgi:hypothetical protein